MEGGDGGIVLTLKYSVAVRCCDHSLCLSDTLTAGSGCLTPGVS